MTSEQPTAPRERMEILSALHELIAALERRVPPVEQVGEMAIVRSAAALRDEALGRITTLDREADADAIEAWYKPIPAPGYIQWQTAGDRNGAE